MVTFSAGKSIPQLSETLVPLPNDQLYLVRGNEAFRIPHTNLISTPNGYIHGAELVFNAGQLLDIGTSPIQRSVVRSSDNTIDMPFTGVLPLDFTGLGAGGLDVGGVAADTWYAVYVIGDSTGALSPNVIASLNVSTPALPGTYDKHRRIGFVRTDVGSQIRPFILYGKSNEREYHWLDELTAANVLLGGNAVAYAVVSLATQMPPLSKRVRLRCGFESDNAGPNNNALRLRPVGSAVVLPVTAVTNGVNSTHQMTHFIEMTTDASQEIEYEVSLGSNSASIWVQIWYDSI